MPLRPSVIRRRYLYAAAAGVIVTSVGLAPSPGLAAPIQANAAHAVVQPAAGQTSAGGEAADHNLTRLPEPAGGPVRLAATDAGPLPPLVKPAAVSTAGWNNLFQNYGNNSGAWSGGDGAQSLLLPNGNTMWFFGDTFLGAVNPDYTRPPLGTGIAHNSAVLQSGLNLGLVHTFAASPGSGGYNFLGDYSWVDPPPPYTSANGYEMLNGDQVMIPHTDLVYKFMQLADRNEPRDGLPYTLVGTVLQQFGYSSATGELIPTGSVLAPNDGPGDNEIIWGVALLQTSDYLYIYGVKPYDNAQLYLARIPAGDFPTSGALWQYWDIPTGTCDASMAAGAWSSDPGAAAPLMGGVSEGFSVTDVNGTFVLLSDNAASSDSAAAIAHYASCPTGFSVSGPAYTVYNPSLPYGYLAYEYRIVPQFSNGSDVLISYSTDTLRVDNSCLFENYYNATIYRPRFLEVQLPNIPGPSGPVRLANAPPPPAGTTPPVPPSQETFHPTGPGDNYGTAECQSGASVSPGPLLAMDANVNGVLDIHWAMQPVAMWLYTVSYCDTDAMNCPADNSTIPSDPACATPNQNCGNLLVWGDTTLGLQYLAAGHRYQITVETAKAVQNAVTAFSNAIAHNFPPTIGCAPDRDSTFPGDVGPKDHLDYLAGADKEVTGIGGVSATIRNYAPWVSPANLADASGEWVELTDRTLGADQIYVRVGWQQNLGGARYTHIQWQDGTANGPYYADLDAYPVNSDVRYAIIYDTAQDDFIIYANGQVLDYLVPAFFTPSGAVVSSDLEDQASQEPGIPGDISRVTGMQVYVNNNWENLAGDTFARVQTAAGVDQGTEPWQTIQPSPGAEGVNSFATWDPGCFVPPVSATSEAVS